MIASSIYGLCNVYTFFIRLSIHKIIFDKRDIGKSPNFLSYEILKLFWKLL